MMAGGEAIVPRSSVGQGRRSEINPPTFVEPGGRELASACKTP
jgi:hypothetical protein